METLIQITGIGIGIASFLVWLRVLYVALSKNAAARDMHKHYKTMP